MFQGRAVLIDAQRSLLLVIDFQERLLPVIHEHEALLANVTWLIRAARTIGVPVAAVEQYPRGLGSTVKGVRELLADDAVVSKVHFSAVAARCLGSLPGIDRAQIVLVGTETHVCLLQTALELLEEGKEVYVAADAVGSRRVADRDLALARMRQEGVRIVTREMVVFEWLREAATPLFRHVSKTFLRG
jgi:nicotinamidase-related amidase